MLRFFPFLLLLLIGLSVHADDTEEQLKSFIKSREVIDQVYFGTASTELTPTAQKKLDAVRGKLKQLSSQGYLLRVEGFASPEGSEQKNVSLSMYRAMAVRNYFRKAHDLDLDLFLTGFGAQHSETARRVDIAAYQRPDAAMALFDDHGTVEKITVK